MSDRNLQVADKLQLFSLIGNSELTPDAINTYIQSTGKYPSVYGTNGSFVYDELRDLLLTKYNTRLEWMLSKGSHKGCMLKVNINEQTILITLLKTYLATESDFIGLDKKRHLKYTEDTDMATRYLITNEVSLYFDVRKGYPQELIDEINSYKCGEIEREYTPIKLICQDGNDMYTRNISFNSLSKTDLDLHYGTGFSNYYDTLLTKVNNTTEGIILWHGLHGTGKTFCIRRLVGDLKNKIIFYLPNTMVDAIGTPGFNSFLLEQLDDEAMYEDEDNPEKFAIFLIIEDGEKAVLKRDNNFSADAVSAILNTTNGILNDILKIQVLVTFNSDINNIDPAIMRKKRAITIREFSKLTKEDSQNLINHLNIDYVADDKMSISEIYALKETDIDDILFDVKEAKPKKIGF
jgi:hypothetical protein